MKNIDKIAKLIAELNNLDTEIKQIDKIALLAANKKTTSCFTLLVTDDEKADAFENKMRERLALDGKQHISSFIQDIFKRFEKGQGPLEEEAENPQEKIHVHLGNINLLEILGIVLRDRKEQKAAIRKQLTDLGINIE